MPSRIVALTPNLALDRTLELDRPLVPGRLHRVQYCREAAGGKGVNLARVVRALGGDAVVAGFLAGWNGQKFHHLLRAEALSGAFEEVAGETRECQILIDGRGHPTEVNERGIEVPLDAWQRLLGRLPEGKIVLSGSLPPGLSEGEFRLVLEGLRGEVFIDMAGTSLATALEVGVAMVTPNRQELGSLLKQDSVTVADAVALYQTYRVPMLLTLGADGAVYIGEQSLMVRAPRVDTVNPVGSGDSLLGAFLWAKEQALALPEALRWAVAAGADNARRGGGRVVREEVEALLPSISVEALP